jgi:hypothetical protein
MIIIGVDFHPEFQQVAAVDTRGVGKVIAPVIGRSPSIWH